MLNIAIGLIHCPRQGISLDDNFRWIKQGGFVEDIFVSDQYSRGDAGNNIWCYENLLKTTADYFLVVENDVEFCQSTYSKLTEFIQLYQNFGYLSLYTPIGYVEADYSEPYWPRIRKLLPMDVGWHKFSIGWGNIAGQAMFFPRSSLKLIMEDERWPNIEKISLENDGRGGGNDSMADDICTKANLPIFYHVPSLAEHNGDISARKYVMKRPWHKGFKYDKRF